MKLYNYSSLKQATIPFVEIFSKAISFINILLLIRVISIYDYADYSYTLAIVLWSALLMDGGINNLIYNKCLKKEITGINKLYTARLFLSIIVIFIIGAFFYFIKPQLYISAILLSFIIYFTSTSSLIKMLSRGLGFMKVDVVSIISEPFLKLLLLLSIYFTKEYFEYDLNTVLVLYLLVGIIAFMFNKLILSKTFTLEILFKKTKSALNLIKESLIQSKYYLLYFLMYIGIVRIDVIFIENFLSKTDLAIYSSAFSIYWVAQLFFFSIITSQFLKFYNDKKRFQKIVIPLTILAIVITFFISPFIYKFLFPTAYSEGQTILKYLIFALFPSVINFFIITKNNYNNKTKQNFTILLLIFHLKLFLYILIEPSNILFYCYTIVIIELVIMLSLLANQHFNKGALLLKKD